VPATDSFGTFSSIELKARGRTQNSNAVFTSGYRMRRGKQYIKKEIEIQ
jgi:hypothetical protein